MQRLVRAVGWRVHPVLLGRAAGPASTLCTPCGGRHLAEPSSPRAWPACGPGRPGGADGGDCASSAQGNVLRVAAADLAEAIPLMVVSDYLTEIAEVVLAEVLRIAWHHVSRRYGEPGGSVAGERLRRLRHPRLR
ncbi:MAG: hypothetical protein U5L11_02300 [Arhodomonas sp.]|nr:hypothetical protein [Arhodomonas sp.]